jgi:DNA-binding winged helix-turn-helix (wHTH) protein
LSDAQREQGWLSRFNPFYLGATVLILLLILFNVIDSTDRINQQLQGWVAAQLTDEFIKLLRGIADVAYSDTQQSGILLPPDKKREWEQRLEQRARWEGWLYFYIVRDGNIVAHFVHPKAEGITLRTDHHLRDPLEWHWTSLPNRILVLTVLQTTQPQSTDPPAQWLHESRYLAIGILAAEPQVANLLQILYAVLFVGIGSGVILLVSRYLSRRFWPPQSWVSVGQPPAETPVPVSPQPVEPAPLRTPEAVGTDPNAKLVQTKGGTLKIYLDRRAVEVRGELKSLTPKEHKLLCLLASEPGRIYSDREIIDTCWETDNPDSPPTSKDVKQQIFFLRKKLGDDAESPLFVYNERGLGYKLLTENSTQI